MSIHDKIAIDITGHAVFDTTANGLDRAISRHLPASPYDLRLKIDMHPGNTWPPGHFDNLIAVSEYLMVLAYLDDKEGRS